MVQNLKIPITSKLKKYIVYLSVWTHRNTEEIQLTVTLYRKKMLLAMQKNYDLVTAVMLCLGVKDDEKASGILRLLEVLLSSDRNAEEKKKILQEEYGIEMTKKLDEEETLSNQNHCQ